MTATNFAVAGESLCDQFGSNVPDASLALDVNGLLVRLSNKTIREENKSAGNVIVFSKYCVKVAYCKKQILMRNGVHRFSISLKNNGTTN